MSNILSNLTFLLWALETIESGSVHMYRSALGSEISFVTLTRAHINMLYFRKQNKKLQVQHAAV